MRLCSYGRYSGFDSALYGKIEPSGIFLEKMPHGMNFRGNMGIETALARIGSASRREVDGEQDGG